MRWLLWMFCLGLLAVAIGCLWLSPRYWPFEMLSAFWPQYLAAFFALGLAAAFSWRPALALFALAGVALAGVALKSLLAPAPAPPLSTHAASFTMMQANLHDENIDHQRFFKFVGSNHPDILALQEVTPHWMRAIRANENLMTRYPYRLIGNGGDTTLLSRFPLAHARREFIPPYDSYLSAQVRLENRVVQVFVIHPEHPTSGSSARRQRGVFDALIAKGRQTPNPFLIVGDFNATPWSYQFNRLKSSLSLTDTAQQGLGFPPSWPVGWGPLMIPIDHCLVSPGLRVTQRTVGPALGSDHLPARMTLALE